jgi:hypothetical protein
MTERIDVHVDQVAVGDEVRVDGFGKVKGGREAMNFAGAEWWGVIAVDERYAYIQSPFTVVFEIRRSSIVAMRRRKPAPSPKPGDWRHKDRQGGYCYSQGCLGGVEREVFRASGGWSRDTRDGQPWVMQSGDPVEVVTKATAETVRKRLDGSVWTGGSNKFSAESWADYYKRIGLDVRPVERRGKR